MAFFTPFLLNNDDDDCLYISEREMSVFACFNCSSASGQGYTTAIWLICVFYSQPRHAQHPCSYICRHKSCYLCVAYLSFRWKSSDCARCDWKFSKEWAFKYCCILCTTTDKRKIVTISRLLFIGSTEKVLAHRHWWWCENCLVDDMAVLHEWFEKKIEHKKSCVEWFRLKRF